MFKPYVVSLVFALAGRNKGNFLLPADYLIQQSGGGTLGLPRGVGVNVHRGTDVSVAQQLLHVLGSRPVGQEVAGERVPICYNKDKSGNPLKIKENRTCPYSFSNHIPSKIRPLRLRSERRCYVRDKAKFAKPGARTYWNRKQNTAVQRNCRSLAPAQVKCPPTQWTASTPQDQYTLFQGNTQEKSCGWTGPSCVLPDTV